MAPHLAIDSRERGLIQHVAAKCTPHVVSLACGDVLCTYSDTGGTSWVLERKRADDLSRSIIDGRWREQTSRLFATGHLVFFVVEGDLRFLDGMYDSLWGAVVNANFRSSRCFRTWDVQETAHLVLYLVKKLQTCSPRAVVSTGGLRPPHQSKRQRDAEADSVFSRQLMCVPSVSEKIAVALVQHFGDLETLQEALRDVQSFPKVQIGAKTYLGKARIAKLAKHFLRSGAV